MMRLKRFLLGLAFTVMLATQAHAFESPVTDPDIKKVLGTLGSAYQAPVADQFGCTQFAWGNFLMDGKVASLQYIPAGDNLKEWKRMVSIQVYRLQGEKEADLKQLKEIQQSILATYKKHSKLMDYKTYENPQKEPASYIVYQIGPDKSLEHNAGAFLRVNKKFAAFIQVQQRGKPLEKSDLEKIKLLITKEKKK